MISDGQFLDGQFPDGFWPDNPTPETPPVIPPVIPSPGEAGPLPFFISPYRLQPCSVCPPTWVATRTYTARCAAGMSGADVTETRQFRSTISEEHAITGALRISEEAARAKLQCYFEAQSSATGTCGHMGVSSGTSFISLADAQQKAFLAAQAAANTWCYENA